MRSPQRGEHTLHFTHSLHSTSSIEHIQELFGGQPLEDVTELININTSNLVGVTTRSQSRNLVATLRNKTNKRKTHPPPSLTEGLPVSTREQRRTLVRHSMLAGTKPNRLAQNHQSPPLAPAVNPNRVKNTMLSKTAHATPIITTNTLQPPRHPAPNTPAQSLTPAAANSTPHLKNVIIKSRWRMVSQ